MIKDSFNCRGEERRSKIVTDYNLTLVARTKLLKGQTKSSCANQMITDVYYTFRYEHRVNKKDTGTFICGNRAAEDFMSKAGIAPIPLFNPLLILHEDLNEGKNENNENASPKSEPGAIAAWNPVALELYQAINLLIICWNKPIHGNLAKIQETLLKYRDYEPYLYRIKNVNNIINKDYKKRTLVQMIEDLRENNPELRVYRFTELNRILAENDVTSYFG